MFKKSTKWLNKLESFTQGSLVVRYYIVSAMKV